MFKLPDPVLWLFIVSSLSGFLFRFIKDGVFKELNFKRIMDCGPLFLMIFLPFSILLFIAQKFSVSAGNALPHFLSALTLSFLFFGIGLPSYLRGILMLGSVVAASLLLPMDFVALASILCALFSFKLSENLAFASESSIDDILPPFVWLSSIMWLSSIDDTKDLPLRAAVVLGVISVSLLMRLVQGPFVSVGNPKDDRIMVKRVVLSITAGLGVLLVVVKLLNLMHYQMLALLCGAAYFIVYLYKDLSGENRYALESQAALRLLILIGFLTLIAMRFYGTFGVLVLAPCAMVAPLSTAALFPGIYLASRALLQVYLQHFNMNVTGINLTHAYTNAAQYAGFLLGLALLLLLKEKMDRRVLLATVLVCCLLSPVLSNFILHSEPTCSFFAASLVSCFLLAVIGPALQLSKAQGSENIALAPGLMISSGLLTSGLLSIGNQSTIAVKSTVLAYGLLFLIVFTLVFWFFFQRGKNSGPKAPEASNTAA